MKNFASTHHIILPRADNLGSTSRALPGLNDSQSRCQTQIGGSVLQFQNRSTQRVPLMDGQNNPPKSFDIQIPGTKNDNHFANQSPKVVGTSSYSAIKRQHLGDAKAARNKISLDQYIKKAVIE